MTKPHGTRGEVVVRPLTDHPGHAFAAGVELHPAAAGATAPDPDLPPLLVEEARTVRRGLLVRFAGIHDRSTAELLRDYDLLRPVEDLEPPAEDELFHHELMGMTVETADGETLGEVVEIFALEPADLLEVRGPRGVLLLPFTRQVFVTVDREARRLVVEPPEGLLEL